MSTSAERNPSTRRTADQYLLPSQASELERLQLQSRVWEPSGRRLLNEIGEGRGVQALPPGHPYLRLPLQFATALRGLLLSIVDAEELERLQRQAETELQDPDRWGITFTLLQCWGQRVA